MISAGILKKAAQGQKVLIDSNIIIYLTDSIQPYEPLAKMLFQMVECGDAQAVISILSIGEVMQGPIRKGLEDIAFEVRDYLTNFPNSYCQDITFDVLNMIGKDTRINWPGLRTVDSLIIACGIYNEVDLIISNDAHFKKSLPSKMLLSFDR
jgi:predicted nucleic acid-binding protein